MTDDLTPERARDPKQYIDEVERQLWCAVEFMHNAYWWQDEGVYDAYLAPALADILAAWTRDRDRLATVTAQRDALVTLVDGAQWYCAASNSSESCPWCGAMKHWGHEQDCEARTALTAIRAERATTPSADPPHNEVSR
jgi:hypothetical protein